MTLPPSSVIVVFGKRGSGKTWWIHERLVKRLPRVLILDVTGEWQELRPDVTHVSGLRETFGALRAAATHQHWCIVTRLKSPEVDALFAALLPSGSVRQSPARLVGGLAIVVDEVHTHCSPSSAGPLFDCLRMGRHAGITLIAADHAPSSCNKELARAANAIVLFKLAKSAPRDMDYLRDAIGPEATERALAWARSAPYRYAVWSPDAETLDLQGPGAPPAGPLLTDRGPGSR